MRANALLFLGVVVFLGGCTDLNVTPRVDGAVVLDAALDAFDAASDGGGAGAAAGGIAGTSPAHAGGAGGGGTPAGGAGGGGRAGAGGQAPVAGANGGPGGAAAGGRPGTGGGTGGATAGCPSTTVDPCVPNKVDTQQETCCEKGTRMHSRTCNPTTCEWGSYGAWSSCSVAAACDPGKTSSCPNNDPCGNRVCSGACQWGDCVPKDGNECLYLMPVTDRPGSNWRCDAKAHPGKSNFCLDNCNWSNTWDNECSTCC